MASATRDEKHAAARAAAAPAAAAAADEELADYEEGDDAGLETAANNVDGKHTKSKEVKKGSYVGIHSSGFRDFLLKPELLLAVTDCGFEHPSEVQQEAIPQAVLGMDIICQAKSGMGKTAVFVLAVLQQLVPQKDVLDTLVLCHTRELAYQICQEFMRFSKYLTAIKVCVYFGGIPIAQHRRMLQAETPQVAVGTPGRILQLAKESALKLGNLKHFIMDECDQMLEALDMRGDVQAIFKMTPPEKQVMMFSATLSKEIRPICRKFTRHPLEIYVDDESKLTLHGLQQYFVTLTESQKNRKLNDLLDALEFNQVVIFVNGVARCKELKKLLVECNFPAICIYGGMPQEERLEQYNRFKEYKARILVSTDLFGRGVDFERVNIVINYDMPEKADTYLHRVGRSGRFGTKGLAISFVSSESEDDKKILADVQNRFEVKVEPLPATIETSTYLAS